MPDLLGSLTYTWPFYAAGLVAFLIGAIPFGLLLTRLAGLGDIRAVGSGNIGATNVLRTGRKGLAALTLLLDGGKGTVAVLAGGYYGPDFEVIAVNELDDICMATPAASEGTLYFRTRNSVVAVAVAE